ncbi:hypothetical protein Ancab_029414 [Ancistrocladus abbreviatus]
MGLGFRMGEGWGCWAWEIVWVLGIERGWVGQKGGGGVGLEWAMGRRTQGREVSVLGNMSKLNNGGLGMDRVGYMVKESKGTV